MYYVRSLWSSGNVYDTEIKEKGREIWEYDSDVWNILTNTMLLLLRETACLGEEDKLYLVLRANLKWQKDTYRNKPQVNNQ